jgi:hypothetical protein
MRVLVMAVMTATVPTANVARNLVLANGPDRCPPGLWSAGMSECIGCFLPDRDGRGR